MKNSLKVELWKATHNYYFILSLVVGLVLVLCNVVETYQNVSTMTQQTLEGQKAGIPLYHFTGCSLFVWWIAHNGVNFGSIYFYQIWPIIAAMPFAWSHCLESNTGAVTQYCSRSNRRDYFFAKYTAVFITGGMAVSLPVWVDLMLNALICPAEKLQFMNLLTTIGNKSFLSSLFFTHPWIHSQIWCGVEFLWGGTVATLSFIAGSRLKFPVLAILFPFSVLYILAIISDIIRRYTNTNLMLDPMALAMQAPLGMNPGWLIFTYIFVFAFLSLVSGVWWVMKSDLI